MTPSETNMKNPQNNDQKDRQPKAYKAPRIISHSSKKLEKDSLTVNACTSFIP